MSGILHISGVFEDHAGPYRSGGYRKERLLARFEENVVVGRLIPAGTGLTYHADRKRQREEELAAGDRESATADEIEQALSEALSAQGSE